jgi:hypothetical protein
MLLQVQGVRRLEKNGKVQVKVKGGWLNFTFLNYEVARATLDDPRWAFYRLGNQWQPMPFRSM